MVDKVTAGNSEKVLNNVLAALECSAVIRVSLPASVRRGGKEIFVDYFRDITLTGDVVYSNFRIVIEKRFELLHHIVIEKRAFQIGPGILLVVEPVQDLNVIFPEKQGL